MHTKLKNTIYLVLLLIFIAIEIFSIFTDYSVLKQKNCDEIKIFSMQNLFCIKYLPDGVTEGFQINISEIWSFLLGFLLITFLFYRKTWDQLTLNIYNSFANKNIKKESFFIGFGIFLYCFVFLSAPALHNLFNYWLAMRSLNDFALISLFDALLISLLISIPSGIAIFFGKKCLNTANPKTIFYKMPLSALLSSIILYILIGAFVVVICANLDLRHPFEDYSVRVFWPLIFIGCVIGICILNLVFAFYLYYYRVTQNKLLWKWIITIILLAPYVVGAIGMLS